MHNIFKALLTVLVAFSFFFVAGFENYHPTPPRFIGSIIEPYQQEGIYVEAKAYDAQESQAYLNRDLIKKGFQPVQLTIQNNTAHTFHLSKEGVDLPHTSPTRIASHVSCEAIPRAVIFKVIGFFFPPFLIAGTIDGAATLHAHLKMKGDYQAKSLKDTNETLLPYSTVHRIVFVPKERYTDEFNLYLKQDRSHQYASFHVTIQSTT